MGKRIKKSPIDPQLRREWLRRYDEGELPPQIAKQDRFDVRTVRKHIEIGKQEREVRDARAVVLRSALEAHYRDICRFAEEMRNSISKGGTVTLAAGSDPLLLALRQHLPRSPLWKDLGSWNRLQEAISGLEEAARVRLREEIELDRRLGAAWVIDKEKAAGGLADVILFQMKALARGWPGLALKDSLVSEPAGEGLVEIRYGFSHLGRIIEGYVPRMREILGDYESKIRGWTEYEEMGDLYSHLIRLGESLRDELGVVVLRRVVPGRCRYCPI